MAGGTAGTGPALEKVVELWHKDSHVA